MGAGLGAVGADVAENAEVAINVYDKANSTLNTLAKATGLGGVYHVGVEIYWNEWSFGYADSGTGVYNTALGESTLGEFRERIPLGHTRRSPFEVISILSALRLEWPGHTYDLLEHNCVHFAKVFVDRLGDVETMPDWLGAMAGIGGSLVKTFGLADEADKNFTPADYGWGLSRHGVDVKAERAPSSWFWAEPAASQDSSDREWQRAQDRMLCRVAGSVFRGPAREATIRCSDDTVENKKSLLCGCDDVPAPPDKRRQRPPVC